MDSLAGRRNRGAPLLLRSGRLCLDFIGTAPFVPAERVSAAGPGAEGRPETAARPGSVARPDAAARPDQVSTPERWTQWLGKARVAAPRQVSDGDLRELRMLRESLRELVECTAADEPAPPGAVSVVNRFAVVDPPPPQLVPGGAALVRPAEQTNAQALSVIARDALDLVTGTHAHRIRVCANPECGFFFADASHAGIRRWCVSCGAAAASARYRRSRSQVAQSS